MFQSIFWSILQRILSTPNWNLKRKKKEIESRKHGYIFFLNCAVFE